MKMTLDTSIFIAVAANEPSRGWIEAVTQHAEAISPASLPVEVVNALSRLARRGLIPPSEASRLWSLIDRIPVTLRQIDLQAALALACSHRMHGYDSFVLQCCLETSTKLLTLDKSLRARASIIGIDYLEP